MTSLEDNYKTHTKTIYDPCPVGFMVPNSGIIQMLLNDSPFTAGNTIVIDDEGHTATAPYNYVTTNSGLRFYVTGGRRINTAGDDPADPVAVLRRAHGGAPPPAVGGTGLTAICRCRRLNALIIN